MLQTFTPKGISEGLMSCQFTHTLQACQLEISMFGFLRVSPFDQGRLRGLGFGA